MPKLTQTDLNTFLTQNPGWSVADSKLQREWTFKNFIHSLEFVNRVGALAEQTGHHPDIDIRYNRVLLYLASHDVGALTERDTDLASKINHLS